jgi:LysR family transcriptional regulator of abg operon
MKMRHIQAFLAVVEAGGIRAAAKRLGISQPALSKTIQELETSLGAPLVTRSAQGSTPTDYGEALFRRLQVVDQEFRRAKDEIDQMLGARRGNVAVGLSAISSMLMISPVLHRFWRRYPDAKVRVVDGLFEHLLNGVRRGSFDFSIGGLPPATDDNQVSAERLFENRLVPMVRRGHPLAGATSLAELAGARWLFTNEEPAFVALMRRHFEGLGLPAPSVALTCESFPAVLETIPNPDLIAMLPKMVLTHPLVQDRMIAVPVAEEAPTTIVALVKRRSVPLTPLAEALAREFRLVARRFSD